MLDALGLTVRLRHRSTDSHGAVTFEDDRVRVLERGSDCHLLPDDEFLLQAGDQLLMASTLPAQRDLELTLKNANELDFVLTGHENSGSLLARLLAPKRSAIAHAGDA